MESLGFEYVHNGCRERFVPMSGGLLPCESAGSCPKSLGLPTRRDFTTIYDRGQLA